MCSDRFPHRGLKGIIRVNRAVIFEVAIFLLLSLFWTNHQLPTTNHLLHPDNHQSPSPQPPNHHHNHHKTPATPPLQTTTVTAFTTTTTAFPPRQTVARSLAFIGGERTTASGFSTCAEKTKAMENTKECPRFRRKKRPPSGSFPRELEEGRGKARGGI